MVAHLHSKTDVFHCALVNDHKKVKKEQDSVPVPVVRMVDNGMAQRNYLQIKEDVEDLRQT